MSQKNSNFKGKRHSPYSNNPWKDRRGDRDRDGSRGGERQVMIKEERVQPSPVVDGSNEQFVEQQVEGSSAQFDPTKFAEKGRREKKFGNRARLYVGNLPRGMTEDELGQLFSQFGENEQVFVDKEKNFGFVRMAYRADGERAIAAINGEEVKGRELRVRFAASSCSIKVHNLHHTVSNELLTHAFSTFGEVEFATVMTDDRGKSLGYGVVDFAKKNHAQNAIEKCQNGCFILTRSPIPVYVTELNRENEEGLPEKQLQKTPDYNFERDSFPRMAMIGSTEYEFGMRWKNLYDAEKKVKDEVELQLKKQRRILEAETEQFHHHEHAELIRQQLLEHQREQLRLEERLRQHEEFIKSNVGGGGLHPPPGGPPLPPSMHGLGPPQPLLMSEGLEGDRPPLDGPSSFTASMQYLLQQSSQFSK